MVNEPSWDDLRADGRVVWETVPGYGMAVYAGQGGDIVVLSLVAGKRRYHSIGPTEFATFAAAFRRAAGEAREIGLEMDVAYEAHTAIDKARAL